MIDLKPGARLFSTVCDTEVVVIAAPNGVVDIQCGGAPMMNESGSGKVAGPDATTSAGTALGKRYTNAAGDLELLCVKPGQGSLAADGQVLAIKGAKPLPSSD